jgi:flavin-binding protein dodecin
MKQLLKSSQVLLVLSLVVGAITFIAWKQDKTPFREPIPSASLSDTSKPGKPSNAKNEYRVEELDKEMEKLTIEMKKMNEELSKIDYVKMNRDIKESLSKINTEQMMKDVQLSIQKIDWDKMQADVNKALAEAKESIAKINMQEVAKQMEEIKNMKLDIKLNAEEINENVKKSLAEANKSIAKAKEEINNLKAFTEALEKDKLIDKKKGYRIKVKDGELFINGTKQSKATYEKYKPYYRKDDFSIVSNGSSISTL